MGMMTHRHNKHKGIPNITTKEVLNGEKPVEKEVKEEVKKEPKKSNKAK